MSSRTALIDVYRDCRGALERFLKRKTGCAETARDLAQEAYLRVATRANTDVIANPRAYLFVTARRMVADYWRTRQSRPESATPLLTLDEAPDSAPSPEGLALSREEVAVLSRAIDALPPRTREVFRRHKFELQSYAEIASSLGIARNTVMVHMTHALAACRDALTRYHRGEE